MRLFQKLFGYRYTLVCRGCRHPRGAHIALHLLLQVADALIGRQRLVMRGLLACGEEVTVKNRDVDIYGRRFVFAGRDSRILIQIGKAAADADEAVRTERK